MEQRHIVIAGGSSGIGRLILEKLMDRGDAVTVLARGSDGWPDSPNVRRQAWDARNPIPEGTEFPERIHGLVYLPGTITLKPFNLLSDDIYREDFEVNVLGAVRLVRAALKGLKAAGGSLVFFGSVAARIGFPFHGSIAASKAALEGLARSLAAEYAPSGLRANVLSLSLTDTPLAAPLLKNDRQRDAARDRHPLAGIGRPEDAAAWALHLLGDESRWVTGQVIGIDGGIGSVKSE